MTCKLADVCLPRHWTGWATGCDAAHLSAPVWPGATLREVKDALLTELGDGHVYGHDEVAKALSGEALTDDFIHVFRAARSAIIRLSARDLRGELNQRRFFLDLEPSPDHAEPVHAYFVLGYDE